MEACQWDQNYGSSHVNLYCHCYREAGGEKKCGVQRHQPFPVYMEGTPPTGQSQHFQLGCPQDIAYNKISFFAILVPLQDAEGLGAQQVFLMVSL